MSVKAELTAEPRSRTGKGAARKLRSEGRVPAVLYGAEVESTPLTLDTHDVEHLFRSISVGSTLIDLTIRDDGDEETVQTLVREVQTHPFRPEVLHVDFYAIRSGVELEVEIPVRLEGIPEGVSAEEGVLEQIMHEVRVRCLPSEIPEAIELDVTELLIGDAIHIADIELESAEILEEPDRTVCTVVTPKALVVEEEAEELPEELELLAEEGELPEGELPEGEELPEGVEPAEVEEAEGGEDEEGEA